DVAIVKFALNLECLEAQFYSYAAFGHGLSDEQRGHGPEPIGGRKANLTPVATAQAYAEEIANNEIAHVAALRTVLGDQAPPCPLIDIGPAFAAAANAAAGTELVPPFSPYRSDALFVVGAFLFEDVGVTAYNGMAPLIENKDVLGAATGILAIEAYHGGSVRTLLYQQGDVTLAPYAFTVADAVASISALRAALGGGKDAALTTGDGGAPSVFPADANALAFARTTQEVLAIVYLGSADAPGGFFPDGVS
ncbi:ferritin-like domain-containing protein, partial [Tribonema minus]